jgi:uncharacterized membrane-anchored protein
MFDKTKERIAKLEETNETFRNVKQHVTKYQVAYAAVGGSALTVVAVRVFGGPQVIVKEMPSLPSVINNTVAPVMNNIVNNTVNNLGPCCKIVQDLDNPSKLWPKVKVLAEEIAEREGVGVDTVRVMLSRHFRDELEHVFGEHYRPYGVTTAN